MFSPLPLGMAQQSEADGKAETETFDKFQCDSTNLGAEVTQVVAACCSHCWATTCPLFFLERPQRITVNIINYIVLIIIEVFQNNKAHFHIAKRPKRHTLGQRAGLAPSRDRGLVALKLDDGWPESVEEQSLLLLVWRH